MIYPKTNKDIILDFYMVGIYKIFVFQRNSGLNLLDIAVDELPGSKELNGMLISGLLTSFMHFSKEILQEEIRLVETKNFRMVFSFNEELVFVVLMDRKGPVGFAEKILNRMMQRFTKQFQEEITASFGGNVSSFASIGEQMEEITKLKGLKLIHHVATTQNKKRVSDFKTAVQKYITKNEKN